MSHKKTLLDCGVLLLGIPCMAAGMAIFTIPNNLAPGGISGLATALAQLIPLSVGVLSLLINIPVLLIAWRMFGWKNLMLTILATVLFSACLDLFTFLLPAYTDNSLLACVFGGVMLGAGMGILFTRGLTTGGTDLICMILRRPFPHLQAGTLLFVIDALVILFAVLIFRDIEVALYSSVAIFFQSKVVDAIMQGVNYAKVILIISDNCEKIRAVLVDENGRGATLFTAKGGYSHTDKNMLMTVAHRSDVPKILKTAKKIDPDSFIIVHDATEVHGEGFREEPS